MRKFAFFWWQSNPVENNLVVNKRARKLDLEELKPLYFHIIFIVIYFLLHKKSFFDEKFCCRWKNGQKHWKNVKNLSKNVEIKLLIWHRICFYWKNRWLSPPKPYIFHKASLFAHLLSMIPKGDCQRFSSHIKRIAPHLPHSWPRSHYLTYVCDWVFISSISKSSWPISMKLGRMMCNELSSIMKEKKPKASAAATLMKAIF